MAVGSTVVGGPFVTAGGAPGNLPTGTGMVKVVADVGAIAGSNTDYMTALAGNSMVKVVANVPTAAVLNTDYMGPLSGSSVVKVVAGVPTAAVGDTDYTLPATLTSGLAGKAPTTRLVSAGTGLSGGGDLSADRTISMPNTGPGAVTSGGGTVYVNSVTTDAQGRITAVATGTPGGGGLSGMTAGRLEFAASATTLGDDAGLAWENTNKVLCVGAASAVTAANAGKLQVHDGTAETCATTSVTASVQVAGNVGFAVRNTTANVEASIVATGTSVQIGAATGHKVVWLQSNGVAGTIETTGDWTFGTNGALATTATGGFIQIPAMAGTPTGAPTTVTGKLVMAGDTTAFKLWANFGGTWKSVTFT